MRCLCRGRFSLSFFLFCVCFSFLVLWIAIYIAGVKEKMEERDFEGKICREICGKHEKADCLFLTSSE